MIIAKSADSLSSFLASVSELSRDWRAYWVEKRAKDDDLATAWLPWFRGEDSAEWISSTALQPKLYRNAFDTKVILSHEGVWPLLERKRSRAQKPVNDDPVMDLRILT
jgi:hypothetical protein